MKQTLRLFQPRYLLLFTIVFTTLFSCTGSHSDTPKETAFKPVAANIKMYTHVWDEIINKGKLDQLNDCNFTKKVVRQGSPADVGINSARAYYANYLT